MRNKSSNALTRVGGFISTKYAAALAAVGTVFASGMAMAAATSPGGAIAAELADGPTEMGLIFAGVAILIGLLLVWLYVRRAAGK